MCFFDCSFFIKTMIFSITGARQTGKNGHAQASGRSQFQTLSRNMEAAS